MKKPPEGWPRISSAVFYDDASKAIDWLCRAFGFEVQLKVEGEGRRIEHSELKFGGGLVMVSSPHGSSERKTPVPGKSPRAVGGVNTQMLAVFVDDADAHCARARAAGARILDEPTTTDYGDVYWSDRTYRAEDPEGHHWWFAAFIRMTGLWWGDLLTSLREHVSGSLRNESTGCASPGGAPQTVRRATSRERARPRSCTTARAVRSIAEASARAALSPRWSTTVEGSRGPLTVI